MSDTLDLSVIVPAYNRAHLITRALDSVARQAVPPREIVVCDDASSDGTPEVVARWARAAAIPVELIVSPHNRGVGATRNIAMRKARGELLAFLDSDDEYLPSSLARLARPLHDHPDAAVSFGDGIVRFADGTPEFRHVARNLSPDRGVTQVAGSDGLYRVDDPQNELLTTSYIPPPAAVFRREAALGVGLMPEKRYGEDWLFFLRLTSQGDFLCQFEDCAIVHRQDDNLTGSHHDYPNALRTLHSLIEVGNDEHVAIAPKHRARLEREIVAQDKAVRYFAAKQGLPEYWRAVRERGDGFAALLGGPRNTVRAIMSSLTVRDRP